MQKIAGQELMETEPTASHCSVLCCIITMTWKGAADWKSNQQ